MHVLKGIIQNLYSGVRRKVNLALFASLPFGYLREGICQSYLGLIIINVIKMQFIFLD